MEDAAPYHCFEAFISREADRFGILTSLLTELGLPYRILRIGDNRHILISPGVSGRENPAPVALVAHYDRVAGSPGANDNSAAVFQLIKTAMTLMEGRIPGWFIIFTDKEELSLHEGLRDQGAYSLAQGFKRTFLGKGRFYIFDACGAGDTLIISTMADRLIRDEEGPGIARTRRMVQLLRDWALKIARNLNMSKVLLAPAPFSDDAGFLRAGIAAQTITVLPSEEASRLAALRNNGTFIDALVNREAQTAETRSLLPETWRSLNGPADSPSRLTPGHYNQVIRFARGLCGG
ncbi:MAG: Zn-dependent exopeptidase M28 [Treponema sp.]|jgi:hypothetical protein|nr:Zn-dependent exopeptidase M28 [Treponema sp.]